MSKFRNGEKVVVKFFKRKDRPFHWVPGMMKFMGEEVTISSRSIEKKRYYLEEDISKWYWYDDDFEEIVEDFLTDKDVLL